MMKVRLVLLTAGLAFFLSGCNALPAEGFSFVPSPTVEPEYVRDVPGLATLAPRVYHPHVTPVPVPASAPTPYYYLKRTLPPMKTQTALSSDSRLATPLPEGASLIGGPDQGTDEHPPEDAAVNPDMDILVFFNMEGGAYHMDENCALLMEEVDEEITAAPAFMALEWGFEPCAECAFDPSKTTGHTPDVSTTQPEPPPRTGIGSQAYSDVLYDSGQALVPKDGDPVFHLWQCADLNSHQTGFVVIAKANAAAEGYSPCEVCYGEYR